MDESESQEFATLSDMSIDLSEVEIAALASHTNIDELERLFGYITLPPEPKKLHLDQHTVPGTNGIITYPEE